MVAKEGSVEMDPRFMDRFSKSPQGIKAAEKAAERILKAAQDLAPVNTGDYLNGLQVVTTEESVEVVAGNWKSAILEFGDRGGAPYNVLTRAAEQAGYKVTRSHK